MLLTNLLLACGLSTAVGSGLALKENSNYLYHEKPQEQLQLDNKKNAITGDIETGVWYYITIGSLNNDNFGCGSGYDLDIYAGNLLFSNYKLDEVVLDDYVHFINNNTIDAFTSYLRIMLDDSSFFNELVYLKFLTQPTNNNFITYVKPLLTLSNNQNIGGSTTEEVFDVVGDTTTGFIDVLTSAIQNGTELIYKEGNFTFLGVMLLIATGISVVFWIFRLLRGITEGVSR